eukprot:3884517-Prymnesium_polylepis.2
MPEHVATAIHDAATAALHAAGERASRSGPICRLARLVFLIDYEISYYYIVVALYRSSQTITPHSSQRRVARSVATRRA